jgi:hypothetical protein
MSAELRRVWSVEPETLVTDIADFVEYRKILDGDEKGEAQVFLDRLFWAFGLVGVREAGTYSVNEGAYERGYIKELKYDLFGGMAEFTLKPKIT